MLWRPDSTDGSLFGWRCGDTITALIAFYAEYAAASLPPSWTLMPLAGAPEAQWPPFTGEQLFGNWAWEHYRVGNIVLLDDLIAGTADTVFWADTKTIFDSDCCAVARDITSPEGHTLQRGRYVYYQVLRAGRPMPSLDVLLANTSKVDLAPRFRRAGDSDVWPDGSS